MNKTTLIIFLHKKKYCETIKTECCVLMGKKTLKNKNANQHLLQITAFRNLNFSKLILLKKENLENTPKYHINILSKVGQR